MPSPGRRRLTRLIAVSCIAACLSVISGAQTKPAPSTSPAWANQFVTVDELARANKAKGSLVSVEGYIVFGYNSSDGSMRISVVDSVDHVLNTKEAAGAMKLGVLCVATAASRKSHVNWTAVGAKMKTATMYTGAGTPQKLVNDVPVRVRITGNMYSRLSMSGITKIELTNIDGEFKPI